jgi:hypothetical protein
LAAPSHTAAFRTYDDTATITAARSSGHHTVVRHTSQPRL